MIKVTQKIENLVAVYYGSIIGLNANIYQYRPELYMDILAILLSRYKLIYIEKF